MKLMINKQTKKIVVEGKQVKLTAAIKTMIWKLENIGYTVMVKVVA